MTIRYSIYRCTGCGTEKPIMKLSGQQSRKSEKHHCGICRGRAYKVFVLVRKG